MRGSPWDELQYKIVLIKLDLSYNWSYDFMTLYIYFKIYYLSVF